MKVSARRRKGYAHSLTAGHHTLIADEPPDEGGSDTGPRPSQLLALSLASCTAITVEMYAERKQWDVAELEVEVDYDLNSEATSRFEVLIKVPGALSDEQMKLLKAVAGKCPIHRALVGAVQINDVVERV